jgi:hypothetical protein
MYTTGLCQLSMSIEIGLLGVSVTTNDGHIYRSTANSRLHIIQFVYRNHCTTSVGRVVRIDHKFCRHPVLRKCKRTVMNFILKAITIYIFLTNVISVFS